MARNQKVKPVWRVFWNTVTVNVIGGTDGSFVNGSQELITASEVEDFDEQCLIKRVVGEIHFWWSAQEGSLLEDASLFRLYMGMIVEDGAYAEDAMKPNNSQEVQDGKWSWLRAYVAPGLSYDAGGEPGAEAGNTSWASDNGGIVSTHIDVKSVRKLTAGDVLRLKVSPLADGIDWQFNYTVNLRILCEV